MITNTILMGLGVVTLSVGIAFALTYAYWGVCKIFNSASSESVKQLQDTCESLHRRVIKMEERESLTAERVKALEDAAPLKGKRR